MLLVRNSAYWASRPGLIFMGAGFLPLDVDVNQSHPERVNRNTGGLHRSTAGVLSERNGASRVVLALRTGFYALPELEGPFAAIHEEREAHRHAEVALADALVRFLVLLPVVHDLPYNGCLAKGPDFRGREDSKMSANHLVPQLL